MWGTRRQRQSNYQGMPLLLFVYPSTDNTVGHRFAKPIISAPTFFRIRRMFVCLKSSTNDLFPRIDIGVSPPQAALLAKRTGSPPTSDEHLGHSRLPLGFRWGLALAGKNPMVIMAQAGTGNRQAAGNLPPASSHGGRNSQRVKNPAAFDGKKRGFARLCLAILRHESGCVQAEGQIIIIGASDIADAFIAVA